MALNTLVLPELFAPQIEINCESSLNSSFKSRIERNLLICTEIILIILIYNSLDFKDKMISFRKSIKTLLKEVTGNRKWKTNSKSSSTKIQNG